MIRFLLRRVKSVKLAEEVVLATTDLREDDALADAAISEGVRVFRGSAQDLVHRYDSVASALDADYVVRVTGDCPFTDAETLDYCLAECLRLDPFDLATTKVRFPVGIDYEIYRASVMRRLQHSGLLDAGDREHLTKYFYDHPEDFRIHRLSPHPSWVFTKRKFTVDTAADYRFAQKVVQLLGGTDFGVDELIRAANRIPFDSDAGTGDDPDLTPLA